MFDLLVTAGIGFVSGVLSGAFGIGGAVVTTPALRGVLGVPALVAVGTPLPVIIPSALTGAFSYVRSGSADIRAGLWVGLAGSATAVAGAYATRWIGGTLLLVVTGVLIIYVAFDMALQAFRPPRPVPREIEEGTPAPRDAEEGPSSDVSPQPPRWQFVVTGAVTGVYSGLLGLGGGFVLVPLLTRWMRYPIKVAIGTSLFAIAILAVPGSITHALLGHVNWPIAAALAVGVVPGAWVGSRITLGASERSVRIAFALLLALVGLWLVANEILVALR